MATRKKSPSARTARARALPAIEAQELPATLRQLTTRMRGQLGVLERQVVRVQLRTRRQAARLLREASEELGRLEALGQRRWRKLDARARRRLHGVLLRLDQAVAADRARGGQASRVTRQAVRRAQRTLRRAAAVLEP
jgi:hypothetical protein